MKNLFGPLSAPAHQILQELPVLIDKTFPLPGRFRPALAGAVAELSRLQTSSRGQRELSYLSRTNHLSAYLRYFLPWNIFRLCKLLPNLDLSLSPGDTILDLGCGPLSLAAALWISRPELRKMPLELHCIDHTARVLEAGKIFFARLAGPDCPWKIVTIRAGLSPAGTISLSRGKNSTGGKARSGKPIARAGEKPAALVCAVNVFNEIYQKVSVNDRGSMMKAAGYSAQLLISCAANSGSILVVEPGVPFSGEFISCLRTVLIERNWPSLAPCPHCETCPFPGGGSGSGKKRWCHFAFDTTEAPAALHQLSAAAGIPKERAVLSFLHAGHIPAFRSRVSTDKQPVPGFSTRRPGGNRPASAGSEEPVRIISDSFPLSDGKFGRYGCSRRGLILAAGKRARVEACASGMLINVPVNTNNRDGKSGALLAEIN